VDDFSALEERVRRAVEMVKRERQARAAAEARVAELEAHATESEARAAQAGARQAELEARAAQAEEQAKAQLPVVEQLKSELSALRAERDQVRQRVERLLAQLDTLEL
jgi:chromosome segregation ATPase